MKASEQIKQLTQQLAQTSQQLDEANAALEHQLVDKHILLSNVSHEVQTPMAAIIRMLELLSATEMNIEQKDLLLTLINSGKRLDTLVSDILDYNRVQQQRLQIYPKRCDVRILVEDCTRLFAERAFEKHIELVCHYHTDLDDEYELDGARLTQIINNILSNSLKFSSKGTVELSVHSQTPGTLRFSVKDEGIGMSDQTIAQIEKSNQQANAMGLGTYMSIHLIKLMQGHHTIHSELGVGTHIEFEIPVKRVEVESPSLAHCEFDRVYLLCSHPVLNDSLKDYLNYLGLNITQVENTQSLKDSITHAKTDNNEVFCVIANATDLEPGSLFWLAKQHKHNFLLTPFNAQLDTGFFNNLHKPIALRELKDLLIQRKTPTNVIRKALSKLALNRPMLQILLADDDEANIKLARSILQPLDAEVVVASDGNKAIELYKEEYFHVVLVSRFLPIKDGLQVCKEIKEIQHSQKRIVPIIGLLPFSSQAQSYFCMESGMDQLIEKPFDFQQLVNAINEQLPS